MTPTTRTSGAASRPLTRYIALLRAVNVGGRVIKMDQLRRAFESLSLDNVQTFIASGNVIFETRPAKGADIEQTIEAGLQKAFSYPIPTFVRTTTEIIAAAEQVPFRTRDLDGSGVYVTFLKTAPTAAETKRVLSMRSKDDDFALVGRELYWLRRRMKERLGEPFPAIGKAIEIPGTMRGLSTVQKLAAKFCTAG